MSVFKPTLDTASTRQPSHLPLMLLQQYSEVNSAHPLYTFDDDSDSLPPDIIQPQPPAYLDSMPSAKHHSPSSSYPSCHASLSKRALICLAQALVAHGRLSYTELLSPNSVSDVTAVVRQVRELLRVGLSDWRQWTEEAAESHSGAEAELSSDLSTTSSSSLSTSADLRSTQSVSSLPDSPSSSASASPRSPSPPPNPRRSLTIITRANGKRPHPTSAARRQSAAATSNSTTYMTADLFIDYFQRSRSLSEAVKRITRDYPSYREVSIYARARRLECRFDERGRFYQPSKKGKSKTAAMSTDDSGRAMEDDESDTEKEEEDGERQARQRAEEEEEAISGSRRKHRRRHAKHRKVRRTEWVERGGAEEDSEEHAGSSEDDKDVQSESSSYMSSSDSSSSSSSSSVSNSEMAESPAAAVVADICQPPASEAAHDVMDALQLLATSARPSLPHSSTSEHNGDGAKHTPPNSTPLTKSAARMATGENKANKPTAARRSVVSAPPLMLPQTADSSLTRRPRHVSPSVQRAVQPLSVGNSSTSFPFRSSALLSSNSAGYGPSPVSPALRPTFGPSYTFSPRLPSFLPSPFGSAPALSNLPLWPPLSALPVSSLATAALHSSGPSQATVTSQQNVRLATMASIPSMAAQASSAYRYAAATTQAPS